jgi:aldehyde dehydrogenase (NAD+)
VSVLFITDCWLFNLEVIEAANSSVYGLGCNVFSENISRALRVAHQLEAGSAWVRNLFSRGCLMSESSIFLSMQVNCAQAVEAGVPFGGYKQSGSGRELGQYALDT